VEPEPAPLADMVVLLAERFGSRGMASVESVGMALLDLCAKWRGLGFGRSGDVGYSELMRATSPGRCALAAATDTSTRGGATWMLDLLDLLDCLDRVDGGGNWKGPSSVIVAL